MAHKPVENLLKERRVYELTLPRLVEASPDISIEQAIELMIEKRAGFIVISENKKVVGIFTETDVVRQVLGKQISWDAPVREVMTRDPMTLSPRDTLGSAIDLMGKHRFYHVPLVEKQKELAGALSVRSIIRYLAESYPAEVLNLPPHPDRIMDTPEGG